MLEADIAGGIYGKQKQHHRADERICKGVSRNRGAPPVFRDTLAKDLMTPRYDAVRGYLLSGAAFFEPQLEKLLERHGFLIYELLTPADIQRSMMDPEGADISAFEHVRYCLPSASSENPSGKMRQAQPKAGRAGVFIIRYLPARQAFSATSSHAQGYLRQS